MYIHELLYKDKLLKGTDKLNALGILDGAELTVVLYKSIMRSSYTPIYFSKNNTTTFSVMHCFFLLLLLTVQNL